MSFETNPRRLVTTAALEAWANAVRASCHSFLQPDPLGSKRPISSLKVSMLASTGSGATSNKRFVAEITSSIDRIAPRPIVATESRPINQSRLRHRATSLVVQSSLTPCA